MYGFNKPEGAPLNIAEIKKKLENMYDIINETMDTRQDKYLSYHDKKKL